MDFYNLLCGIIFVYIEYSKFKGFTMKRKLGLLIYSLFCFLVFSQVQINYTGGNNYILTERTDLRRYDNGKYTGLVSREVKAFIKPEAYEEGYKYEGFFDVNQDTRRALNFVSKGIHDYISSVFTVSNEGEFTMIKDCGYPSFRNFPVYPEAQINIGDEWTGTMIRAVDPYEKGIPTRISSTVLYKYTRDTVYNNEEVYVISANWAMRYNCISEDADLNGDQELKIANGKHTATIYVSKKTGRAILIKDYADESFYYKDGSNVSFKGNIAMFTEYPPTISYEQTTIASSDPIQNDEYIEYEVTANGIRICIYELNFLPDSSELLSKDKPRIKIIAEYLKRFENNKILITGHTAKAGNSINDYELSLQRAYSISEELSSYGVKAENLISQGKGSDSPVADNDTEEGRAKNRRVEIMILGDISQ